MIVMPKLRTTLIDLLYETRDDDLRLIIGGGYGIFLKREQVVSSGVRTLLTEWPEARSTNDLDLFLRPELLIDSRRLEPLAAALDRVDDENKEFGRYHAVDLYAVLAMTSEDEWKEALALRGRHRSEQAVVEATRIANQQFSSVTSLGILRLRESPYFRPALQLDEFTKALAELFPPLMQKRDM